KPLFTTFCVIRERTISKAVTVNRLLLIHDVDYAARIQPPHSDHPCNDRHHITGVDRCLWRPRLHPTQAEVIPKSYGSFRPRENFLTLPQLGTSVIHVIPSWWHGRRSPD